MHVCFPGLASVLPGHHNFAIWLANSLFVSKGFERKLPPAPKLYLRMPKNISYFWKNIDSYSYTSSKKPVHGLFSGLVFPVDHPFILKDFKKANFLVLHIKERDYLSVYAIYLMVLSRFKFYRQKNVGLRLNYPSMAQEGKYWRMPL